MHSDGTSSNLVQSTDLILGDNIVYNTFVDIQDNFEALKTITRRTEIVAHKLAITNAKIFGTFAYLMSLLNNPEVTEYLVKLQYEMGHNIEEITEIFEGITENQNSFMEAFKDE